MGKNPRKTRGEYRPIYEALFTGKDYRALPKDAKLVLLTLKGLGGVMGIKVWPALIESLAELTGMTVREARTAVSALVAHGWIEHGDGVVWVVRGLHFEPQMTPNNKDHRTRLQDLASGLPSCTVVERFREEYADYFTEPSRAPATTPASTPASATGSASPSPTPTSTPPQPPPHLLPVPTPVATSTPPAGGDRPLADDARLLTIAANAGLDRRYSNRNSLIATSGHAHVFAESMREHGIDVEFAAAAIFAYASAMTKPEPPHSLKYFTNHVIERWQQEAARKDAAGYQPTAIATAEVDQMRTFAMRYARDGSLEWQQYCDQRNIAWRAAS